MSSKVSLRAQEHPQLDHVIIDIPQNFYLEGEFDHQLIEYSCTDGVLVQPLRDYVIIDIPEDFFFEEEEELDHVEDQSTSRVLVQTTTDHVIIDIPDDLVLHLLEDSVSKAYPIVFYQMSIPDDRRLHIINCFSNVKTLVLNRQMVNPEDVTQVMPSLIHLKKLCFVASNRFLENEEFTIELKNQKS